MRRAAVCIDYKKKKKKQFMMQSLKPQFRFHLVISWISKKRKVEGRRRVMNIAERASSAI